jgi:hypothetical protein
MAKRKQEKQDGGRKEVLRDDVYLYLPTAKDPFRVLHIEEALSLVERRKLSQRALLEAMDLCSEVINSWSPY